MKKFLVAFLLALCSVIMAEPPIITHSLDSIEKKLDKNGVLVGIDVIISLHGGVTRVPYAKTFPPGDINKLEAVIKDWAVICTREYEVRFGTIPEKLTAEKIDPTTIAFDSAEILIESRK